MAITLCGVYNDNDDMTRTPLMMAVRSNDWDHMIDEAISRREWQPAAHLFPDKTWTVNQQRMLDTVRALIENGLADPAETSESDMVGVSAISFVESPTNPALEYLLQQIEIVDVSDVIKGLFRFEWTSDITQVIILHLVKLATTSQGFRILDKLLTHLILFLAKYSSSILSKLPSISRKPSNDLSPFQEALRLLLEAGVDLYGGSLYKSPLNILTLPLYFGPSEDLDDYINDSIRTWLHCLEECDVDIKDYLQTEHNLYWYGGNYAFTTSRKFGQAVSGSEYKKVKCKFERFIFFDFTEPDLKNSVTVAYKKVYDSRDRDIEKEIEQNVPGSWRD